MKEEQRKVPAFWQQARDDLAKQDPVMQRLVSQFNDSTLYSRGDAFTTLVRTIISQQISVKAAASVWQKLTITLSKITPEILHSIDPAALRACGLSSRSLSDLM